MRQLISTYSQEDEKEIVGQICNDRPFRMKNLCMFLFGLLTGLNVTAQIPDMSKSLLSPNAASLGIYGEIPVSLYTGTPDISIPLFEIENINLPVTLNYHASGVRPDQQTGWVGSG
jgi:hypothetical protein